MFSYCKFSLGSLIGCSILVLYVLQWVHKISCSFDLSELENGVYHKLDITRFPVSLKLDGLEEEDVDNVMETVKLSSVFGQMYACSYKSPAAILANLSVEPEKPWLHVNVSILMNQYIDGEHCFRASKGWWTYQVCPWKEVVQYHDDKETKTSSGRSLLGLFGREYNWSNSSLEDIQVSKKFHSQYFVNGTTCDLTEQSRTAEIQYVCHRNDDPVDGIVDIQEPQTCRYVIQVHVQKLCGSSVFRRSKSGHIPVEITCNPALPEDQYQRFKRKEGQELMKKALQLEKEAERKRQAEAAARDEVMAVALQKQVLMVVEQQLMAVMVTSNDQSKSLAETTSTSSPRITKAAETNNDYQQGANKEEEEEEGDVGANDFEAELARAAQLRANQADAVRSQLLMQMDAMIERAEAALAQEDNTATDGQLGKKRQEKERDEEESRQRMVMVSFDRKKALAILKQAIDRVMTKVEQGDPRITLDYLQQHQQHNDGSRDDKADESASSSSATLRESDFELKVEEAGTAGGGGKDPFDKDSLYQSIEKELSKAGLNKPGGRRHFEIRVIQKPPSQAKQKSRKDQAMDGTKKDGQEEQAEEDEESQTVRRENTERVLGQMIAAVLTSDGAVVRQAYDQVMIEENYAAVYDDTYFGSDNGDDDDGNDHGPVASLQQQQQQQEIETGAEKSSKEEDEQQQQNLT